MLQLKPMEESFYRISKYLTGETIDRILICEGKRDSEVIKGVIRKIFKETKGNIAITDCGGEKVIPEITKYIVTLSSVSKKPKIICFIDTDEIVPQNWLKEITDPIINKDYHFVFGSTKPVLDDANFITRYIYFDEARMYRLVKDGFIFYGAMGNSAWSSELFISLKKKYGYYINTTLTMGGEDYELTLRALSEGFKGTFNENAWVWHDQRNINTLRKLL